MTAFDTSHRLIAVVLPQFHPIAENDTWWGTGFTEWRNVAKAKPLFPGHYQPHVPADLGFYDMRLQDTWVAQAKLAAAHGITGFCFYHYWFNGTRLLEKPVDGMLATGAPDFPFCLCWANEPWSRRWNGSELDVLQAQTYSPDDDVAHFRSLLPALLDRRYIRIEGRPLLVVYRVEHMDDPRRTFDTWRRLAVEAGLPGLYLAQFESHKQGARESVERAGLDVSIEFAPDWRRLGASKTYSVSQRLLHKFGRGHHAFYTHRVSDYDDLVRNMLGRSTPDYPFWRCVTPGFDNSARKMRDATILVGNTPERFGEWLEETFAWTVANRDASTQVVFVNAWNEWAEGNHLEPCLEHGRAFLEATRSAREKAGW